MIDEKNKKILDVLQRDSHVSLRELGELLGISATAVHKRIKKMDDKGIIKKRALLINPEAVGMNMFGFVGVEVELRKLDRILSHIRDINEILGIYLVTGNFDVFIKVITENMETFRKLVLHRVNRIDGVIRTSTIVAFEVRKETTYVPLPGGVQNESKRR